MARNEPLSFGKPLVFLVLVGVGFGAYHLWKTWPTTVEGPGFSLKLPPRWEVKQVEGRWVAEGLIEKTGKGFAWISTTPHGTVAWPDMALDTLRPNVATSHVNADISIYQGLIAQYDDGDFKYMAAVVNTPAHFITFSIGSHKSEFEQHRALFDKCLRSIKPLN